MFNIAYEDSLLNEGKGTELKLERRSLLTLFVKTYLKNWGLEFNQEEFKRIN